MSVQRVESWCLYTALPAQSSWRAVTKPECVTEPAASASWGEGWKELAHASDGCLAAIFGKRQYRLVSRGPVDEAVLDALDLDLVMAHRRVDAPTMTLDRQAQGWVQIVLGHEPRSPPDSSFVGSELALWDKWLDCILEAHERGIVHGGLNERWLDPLGEVHGWGLARLYGRWRAQRLPWTPGAADPRLASPDALLGQEPRPLDDLYAFAMLWRARKGEPLSPVTSVGELSRRQAQGVEWLVRELQFGRLSPPKRLIDAIHQAASVRRQQSPSDEEQTPTGVHEVAPLRPAVTGRMGDPQAAWSAPPLEPAAPRVPSPPPLLLPSAATTTTPAGRPAPSSASAVPGPNPIPLLRGLLALSILSFALLTALGLRSLVPALTVLPPEVPGDANPAASRSQPAEECKPEETTKNDVQPDSPHPALARTDLVQVGEIGKVAFGSKEFKIDPGPEEEGVRAVLVACDAATNAVLLDVVLRHCETDDLAPFDRHLSEALLSPVTTSALPSKPSLVGSHGLPVRFHLEKSPTDLCEKGAAGLRSVEVWCMRESPAQ